MVFYFKNLMILLVTRELKSKTNAINESSLLPLALPGPGNARELSASYKKNDAKSE